MRCSFFKEKTFLGDEKQPLLSKIFCQKLVDLESRLILGCKNADHGFGRFLPSGGFYLLIKVRGHRCR